MEGSDVNSETEIAFMIDIVHGVIDIDRATYMYMCIFFWQVVGEVEVAKPRRSQHPPAFHRLKLKLSTSVLGIPDSKIHC